MQVEKDAFVMRCRVSKDGSWMVEISGCKTPSDTIIPINSSMIDGNYEWKCTTMDDGQISMQRNVHENATCGEHSRGE